MFQINNRLFALAAISLATAAGTASATTYSSFLTGTTINGISITPPVVSPNLSFTVTLAAATPTPGSFTYLGNTYTITDIIGFYLLAPGYNDPTQPALVTIGNFADDSDSHSPGSISGWRSNPNQGITAGGSTVFTFPSIDYAHYTQIGFHVRISGTFPGTTGNTGNITGTLVPTPGAAALLGLGGLAISRRRRA